MNICGVLVHANPTKLTAVIAGLKRLDGVEVYQTAEGGRVIVTVEDTACTTALDTMASIHRLDGVVAAALVYHQLDTAAEGAASNT